MSDMLQWAAILGIVLTWWWRDSTALLDEMIVEIAENINKRETTEEGNDD